MRILFLNYDRTNACSFYRSGGIANDLRKKTGHEITVAQWNEINMHWGTIMDYDLIMMQRPFGKSAFELCDYIKRLNRPLWVDYDDNLLCIPQSNKAYLIYDDEAKEYIKKILGIADVISVTTDDLKKSFSPFISLRCEIKVIPNAFNDTVFKRGEIKERSNIITWRGTETHIADITSVTGAISKACIEFPDKQFLFLGYLPWFLGEDVTNVFAMKEMDLILYFHNLFNMKPAVIHVPLIDNLFNRCKSNIAFIEGSYFGAACLVPDFWDVPGVLRYKTEDDYYNALKALISGEIDIKAQNNIAWEFIQDTLILSKVNTERVKLINSL
jgi:hypothetical protein